jgi:hypothetical protein
MLKKKEKSGQPLTEGEELSKEIFDLQEFKVIRKLCNKGRHSITQETTHKTSKTSGLQVGISMAGDRLNQNYLLIDGKNSQDYFIPLFRKYNEFFKTCIPGFLKIKFFKT